MILAMIWGIWGSVFLLEKGKGKLQQDEGSSLMRFFFA
jgi:hypothetical protein